MSLGALTVRPAAADEAAQIASAERAIARVPGKLAARPEEIDDEAIRGLIVSLEEHGRGRFVVAERAGVYMALWVGR